MPRPKPEGYFRDRQIDKTRPITPSIGQNVSLPKSDAILVQKSYSVILPKESVTTKRPKVEWAQTLGAEMLQSDTYEIIAKEFPNARLIRFDLERDIPSPQSGLTATIFTGQNSLSDEKLKQFEKSVYSTKVHKIINENGEIVLYGYMFDKEG